MCSCGAEATHHIFIAVWTLRRRRPQTKDAGSLARPPIRRAANTRLQATGRGAPSLSESLLCRPAPEPSRWADMRNDYHLRVSCACGSVFEMSAEFYGPIEHAHLEWMKFHVACVKSVIRPTIHAGDGAMSAQVEGETNSPPRA